MAGVSNQLDLLLEAEKRGVPIPDEYKDLLAQARSHGLLAAPESTSAPEPATPQPQQPQGPSRVRRAFTTALGMSGPFSGTPPTSAGGIGEGVFQGALPAAGGIAGGVGGTMLGGPVLGLAGESAGSAGGEWLNQKLGITPPSNSAIGIAAVTPGAARGAGAGWNAGKRAFGRHVLGLPDVAMSVRNNAAREAEQEIAAMTRPDTKAEAMFRDVIGDNPSIPLQPIRDAARPVANPDGMFPAATAGAGSRSAAPAMRAELEQLYERANERLKQFGSGDENYQALTRSIEALKQRIGYAGEEPVGQAAAAGGTGARDLAQRLATVVGNTQTRDVMPFSKIWAEMKNLNAKIADAKTAGGGEFADLMQLKRGFWQALEKAAASGTGPQYAKLKAANAAWRNEIAEQTTSDIIQKAITYQEGRPGEMVMNINAANAMNALDEAVRLDPFLKDSFKPGAFDRIKSSLDKIRQLPIPGAPQGASAGSSSVLSSAIKGGGLGATIGGAAAGFTFGASAIPGGAMIGGGAFGAGNALLSEQLTKMFATPEGAKIAQRLAASPGGFNYPKLAVMAQFLRAQEAPSREEIVNFLKQDTPMEQKDEAVLGLGIKERVMEGVRQYLGLQR